MNFVNYPRANTGSAIKCTLSSERWIVTNSIVRYVVLIFVAVLLAVLQYSWFGNFPSAPNLLLALAAWAMVDGTQRGVVPRAWIIGTIADLFDPASIAFNALMFLSLAIIYLPVRALIFRSRMTGWAAWAFIAMMIMQFVDGSLYGFGDSNPLIMMIAASWTAIVAVALGWMFRGIPKTFHPIGQGGA